MGDDMGCVVKMSFLPVSARWAHVLRSRCQPHTRRPGYMPVNIPSANGLTHKIFQAFFHPSESDVPIESVCRAPFPHPVRADLKCSRIFHEVVSSAQSGKSASFIDRSIFVQHFPTFPSSEILRAMRRHFALSANEAIVIYFVRRVTNIS